MLAARSGRLRLAPRLVGLAVAIYAFVWISGFPHHYDDDELHLDSQREKSASQDTPHPVEFDHYVVSVKTTATEAYAKLPSMLLLTKQAYYDPLLLMGDLRMDIGAFHVEDVLDRYGVDFVAHNEDLERYGLLKHASRETTDYGRLVEGDAQKEAEIQARLDKYKVLRMLERAWELRPERLWYVFVDADTYLVRSNLETMLGQYDSSQPMFFANPPDSKHPDSSISGSTFIVSVQVMRELFVDREKILKNWDQRIPELKSSFDVLNTVLTTELNLSHNLTWPGISGFHPVTVPFGAGLWCEQVYAMESVPAESRSEVWRYERDRDEVQHVNDPLSFSDLWSRFVQPEDLSKAREDWDNLSSGPENAPWNILFQNPPHRLARRTKEERGQDAKAANGEESWEKCQESCNNNALCIQWSYSSNPSPNYNENGETKCHLSRSMRLGTHVEPVQIEVDGTRSEMKWRSGWRKDRFEKWAQHQRCKGQQNKN